MIQKIINLLDIFDKRYCQKYYADYGTFDRVEASINDDHNLVLDIYNSYDGYFLHVSLNEENDELMILNDNGEDITGYAEENEWSVEDVNYIKYGKNKNNFGN